MGWGANRAGAKRALCKVWSIAMCLRTNAAEAMQSLRTDSMRVRKRTCRGKVKLKLAYKKARTIQQHDEHNLLASRRNADVSSTFIKMLFGKLPEFFEDEAELRAILSAPDTRAKLPVGFPSMRKPEPYRVSTRSDALKRLIENFSHLVSRYRAKSFTYGAESG